MKTLAFVSTAHIHFKGIADEIAAMGDSIRIGAIWDDNEQRGQKFAERYGVDFASELERLIARSDIDGFIVCAPNNQRLSLLAHLIPAGKPVMCEKPLAITAAEASEIRALVSRHKATLTTGFFRMAYGVYQTVVDVLASNALGAATHARLRNTHDGAYRRIFDDPDVAWMVDAKVAGGGGGLDMGAHALHLLAWLFGPAEEIWATIANRAAVYPDIDDHGIFHVRFRNGMFATAEAGWINIEGPGELEIFGADGTLHAVDTDDGRVDALTIVDPDKRRHTLAVPQSGPKGVRRLLAASEGRVAKDELALELDTAVIAAAMMEAAYHSDAAGTWQRVKAV